MQMGWMPFPRTFFGLTISRVEFRLSVTTILGKLRINKSQQKVGKLFIFLMFEVFSMKQFRYNPRWRMKMFFHLHSTSLPGQCCACTADKLSNFSVVLSVLCGNFLVSWWGCFTIQTQLSEKALYTTLLDASSGHSHFPFRWKI